jgi:hypothetical protein
VGYADYIPEEPFFIKAYAILAGALAGALRSSRLRTRWFIVSTTVDQDFIFTLL